MRSRALLLVLSLAALAAFAGAAVFVTISEQHIATTRSAARAFDAVVREATNGLATAEGVEQSLGALAGLAHTDKAKAAIEDAVSKVAAFSASDRRARDYVKAGLPLMAVDVITSDRAQSMSAVLKQIDLARVAEEQAADTAENSQRKLEATVLAAAGIVALAAFAGMIIAAPKAAPAPDVQSVAGRAPVASHPDDLLLQATPESPSKYVTARPAGPVLRAASQLCTDLGRVTDVEELNGLIGQAADLMDASGLMVWMITPDGSELRPALSHGYPAEMLARLPALARSADNASALAYRTAQLQIVLARPGSSNGAVVAPLLSSDGCVGVISAEIRGGGETSESVQALAAIFAAQLAVVLHSTPDAHEQRATGTTGI